MRAYLNPPPESNGTNRIEYYLPDVGTDWWPTSNRFYAAREIQFSRKRNNMCFDSFFGRTERPDRMGSDIVLFDGDCHHRRWRWTHFAHNTLLLCRGMRKGLSFVVMAGEAQDSGWT